MSFDASPVKTREMLGIDRIRDLVSAAPEGTTVDEKVSMIADVLHQTGQLPKNPTAAEFSKNYVNDLLAATLESQSPIASLAGLARSYGVPSPQLRAEAIALLKDFRLTHDEATERLGHLPLSAVRTQLEALILEGIPESERQLERSRLAELSGQPLNVINNLDRSLQSDLDQAETCEIETGEAAVRLPNAISARHAKLPIAEALQGDGGKFAAELLTTAKAMPIAPEFLVTALIPVLATSIGTSSRLIVNPAAGWIEKPIFWALNVLRTGELKTPVLNLAKSGLELLEDIAHKDYQLALQQYDQECERFNTLSPSEKLDTPKPETPVRRRCILRDDTPQARALVHYENPRGLLRFRDEGSAFLSELGRFSRGKGDGGEAEADLSEFNGSELDPDRVTNRVERRLSQTALQRLGATQPEILRRLMGDHADERGLWARYLFCLVDTPPAYLDFSSPAPPTKLTNTLANLHKRLETLPEQDYLLSDTAKPIFQAAYNHYRSIVYANSESDLGSAAAAAKMGTYLSRLTLWLHLINAALADVEPSPTIAAETVEMAARWTHFYWQQNQLLMARNAPTQELTGDLLKVWSYIEKYQLDDFLPSDISAKVKFKDGPRSRREKKACYKSSKYHTELLQQLVKMGLLQQSGKRFSRKPENLETSSPNLDEFQTPEGLISKDSQPLKPQEFENLTDGCLSQNGQSESERYTPLPQDDLQDLESMAIAAVESRDEEEVKNIIDTLESLDSFTKQSFWQYLEIGNQGVKERLIAVSKQIASREMLGGGSR